MWLNEYESITKPGVTSKSVCFHLENKVELYMYRRNKRELSKHLFLNMTYICLGRNVSKVEKFRFLQTCHSYNESATVSFKVSF